MKRHAFIPSSPAPLEERVALSPVGPASTVATAPVLTQAQSLNLYGIVLGRDTTVGSMHKLQAASATLSPLGRVSLKGFLAIPSRGGENRLVHGLVTISNLQGTVTISLKGMVTVYRGPISFASGSLTYKIDSATKADHGAKGTGPVSYGPGPVLQAGRFLLDFGNYPPPP